MKRNLNKFLKENNVNIRLTEGQTCKDFLKKYPQHVDLFKKFIEKNPNDSYAYYMFKNNYCDDREWTENMIGAVSLKTNRLIYVYKMTRYCKSKIEWAEKIIDNYNLKEKNYDSLYDFYMSEEYSFKHYIYLMVKYCNLNIKYFEKVSEKDLTYYSLSLSEYRKKYRKWAESVIEKAMCSDTAYLMAKYCGSDRGWSEKIIERNKDSMYAYKMVKNCGSDRGWAEKIIERNKDSIYAYQMVRDCGSDKKWAENISKKFCQNFK